MKKIIPLFLLLSMNAYADSLHITLKSHHFNDEFQANENNIGFMYEKDINDRLSLLGGAYRNSYNNSSVIVGAEYQVGYFGVQAGLATGYSEMFGNDIQPIGAVFGELPLGVLRIRATVIPHKDGAIGLSVNWRL